MLQIWPEGIQAPRLLKWLFRREYLSHLAHLAHSHPPEAHPWGPPIPWQRDAEAEVLLVMAWVIAGFWVAAWDMMCSLHLGWQLKVTASVNRQWTKKANALWCYPSLDCSIGEVVLPYHSRFFRRLLTPYSGSFSDLHLAGFIKLLTALRNVFSPHNLKPQD